MDILRKLHSQYHNSIIPFNENVVKFLEENQPLKNRMSRKVKNKVRNMLGKKKKKKQPYNDN